MLFPRIHGLKLGSVSLLRLMVRLPTSASFFTFLFMTLSEAEGPVQMWPDASSRRVELANTKKLSQNAQSELQRSQFSPEAKIERSWSDPSDNFVPEVRRQFARKGDSFSLLQKSQYSQDSEFGPEIDLRRRDSPSGVELFSSLKICSHRHGRARKGHQIKNVFM
jgi:hypothetical protein